MNEISENFKKFAEAMVNVNADLDIAKDLDEITADDYRSKLSHLRSAREYASKFVNDESLPSHYEPLKDLLDGLYNESTKLQREVHSTIENAFERGLLR